MSAGPAPLPAPTPAVGPWTVLATNGLEDPPLLGYGDADEACWVALQLPDASGLTVREVRRLRSWLLGGASTWGVRALSDHALVVALLLSGGVGLVRHLGHTWPPSAAAATAAAAAMERDGVAAAAVAEEAAAAVAPAAAPAWTTAAAAVAGDDTGGGGGGWGGGTHDDGGDGGEATAARFSRGWLDHAVRLATGAATTVDAYYEPYDARAVEVRWARSVFDYVASHMDAAADLEELHAWVAIETEADAYTGLWARAERRQVPSLGWRPPAG